MSSHRPSPRVVIDDTHLPLVLVGLPGAGKTTVARLLASALGVQVTDTDAEIRRRARKTIPEVFSSEGEEGFRDRETRALRAVLTGEASAQGVIALGGGAVLREENRAMLASRTVIHLSASPRTAAAHVGDGAGRPLVGEGPDRGADSDAAEAAAERLGAGEEEPGARHVAVLARMEALHEQRAPLYAEVASVVVPTDGLTPEQVAALVLVALGADAPGAARALSVAGSAHRTGPTGGQASTAPAPTGAGGRSSNSNKDGDGDGGSVLLPTSRSLGPGPDGRLRLTVRGERPYDVVIGHELADEVLAGVRSAPGGGAGGVAVVHAPELAATAERCTTCLSEAGLRVQEVVVPGGEASKTSAVLDSVWEALGAMRMGRDGCVVAVGGGATTDLAGLAAATWLRGVPVVQVPTSLLAMVDAAVGGKTGVNTAHGKNLVGAFHAPAAVVCDLAALETLPPEELRAGLGEVVKCGLVADPVILDRVLSDADDAGALSRWDAPVLAELVARSVAVKAAVVGEDLTEAGLREVLNYGHTYAHAVETVSGYTWRHGEAVAVGCVFAAEVARRLGLLGADVLSLHREAFAAAGLRTAFPQGAGRFEEVLAVMRSDKKVRAGAIRMVLLDEVAHPVRGVEPGEDVLRAAHEAVAGPEGAAA